eukprot:13413165-Alexandrium_andersonii.AAC.1
MPWAPSSSRGAAPPWPSACSTAPTGAPHHHRQRAGPQEHPAALEAVSYTHLTLPTICSV